MQEQELSANISNLQLELLKIFSFNVPEAQLNDIKKCLAGTLLKKQVMRWTSFGKNAAGIMTRDNCDKEKKEKLFHYVSVRKFTETINTKQQYLNLRSFKKLFKPKMLRPAESSFIVICVGNLRFCD